jgi:hypothetical protein
MSRLKFDYGQLALVLKAVCAVAALAALALFAPADWRGRFARLPSGGGR